LQQHFSGQHCRSRTKIIDKHFLNIPYIKY
jgi:hypothetical protein